jgi:hypothetical protein
MKTGLAAAPIALALALALGGCGKSGTDANAAAANETVFNDEGLLSNDEAANLVDEDAGANAGGLDNAALGNDLGGNDTGTGNAL